MLNSLLGYLELLTGKLKQIVVAKNLQTEASKKLYETALTFIGQDASPNDQAPDEFGCAESVNSICERAWGEPAGGRVSTYQMYYILINHKKFVEVHTPLAGDIILSPTGIGGGKNGIANGHVGIVGSNSTIMSSDSKTGLWKQNYDFYSWKYRYQTLGGFQIHYFRRIL